MSNIYPLPLPEPGNDYSIPGSGLTYIYNGNIYTVGTGPCQNAPAGSIVPLGGPCPGGNAGTLSGGGSIFAQQGRVSPPLLQAQGTAPDMNLFLKFEITQFAWDFFIWLILFILLFIGIASFLAQTPQGQEVIETAAKAAVA